ncbi:MAG: HAMP domain-containing protein [Proteobacteria bacterium]|jgi:nitrogen fixation/metabolism regulation signal transduction histidine kinase|nr:HAMP domain-containing protein [Pseudomonadota bacterium]
MAIKPLTRKLFSGSLPIVVLFVLLLASLYLMSDVSHDSALFGRLYSWLLGINLLTIMLFIGLIGRSLWLLIRQYRQQIAGSRLTARLVIMFVILSVTPVSAVYFFSLDFIKRGIDSWFDVRVESALTDALELGQAALGIRTTQLLRDTKAMAKVAGSVSPDMAVLTLNDLRSENDANELTLFSKNGHIVAASSLETENLIPQRLDAGTQLILRQGRADVALLPIRDAGLFVRVAVNVPGRAPPGEGMILQALYPVPARINELADSVQSAFGRYREVAYLRIPLKYSFILTLSLVLLLSIMIAIWAAFYAARRLVAPITDLAEGTRAVAAGDYKKRLPLPGRDELGFLVRSFNEMTHHIDLARNEAEAQRAYLETVLGNLSSGVITLDINHRIRTSNPAASYILTLDLEDYQGKALDDIATEHPVLMTLVDTVYEYLGNQVEDWQEEVTLFSTSGRQVLMCRGTPLPESSDIPGGSLIVFDDITTLVQAQRNAAWGEVARRLAHEIKNPLTPIQLSAERLRHKYLKTMPPKDADILDRATHTIVQQVETLKDMVKAFSDYARMPDLRLEEVDLNNLVREVRELYRGGKMKVRFNLQLDPETPHIEADTGRLRQLLTNLVKNALEAMAYQEGIITISTRCAEEHACQFVELGVRDTGPGISSEMMGQLFEPYITSKPRGSGLGLAIVKKIVEEHGGMLSAENPETGGAYIVIRFPVLHKEGERPASKTDNDQKNSYSDNDNAAA